MRRFWSLVDRGAPADCWPWQGGSDARGRPFFSSIGGLRIPACRFAFELSIGPLGAGEVVLHACGNGRCVNPSHLYRSVPPTSAARSGRYRRGSGSKLSKLTEDDVRQIRRRAADGASHVALAAMYGVSQSTISRVVHGRSWKHVLPAQPKQDDAGARPRRRRATD